MVTAGEPPEIDPAAGTRRVRARPVRAFAPSPDPAPVVIAAPPAREDAGSSRLMTAVLPALSSLGIVGFALVSGSLLYVLLGVGLSVLGIGAAVGSQVGASRSRRRRQQRMRERYGEHLDRRFAHLTDVAEAQRRAATGTDPDPRDWTAVLAGDRLWERRPGDPDFLSVRLGRGRVALATPVRLEPAGPSTDEEPDLREEAELLVAATATVDDLPICVDLARRRCLAVQGPTAHVRPLLRALVLNLSLTHAPGELRLLPWLSSGESAWLARLPHALQVEAVALDALVDQIEAAPGAAPLVLVLDASSQKDAQGRLARLTRCEDPRLRVLLVADDDVDIPPDADVLVGVDGDGGLRVRFADGTPTMTVARPDEVSHAEAACCAEALGSVGSADGQPIPGPVRLRSLLDGFGSAAELAVPLGRDEFGRTVTLDLAEAASGGSGPHGLLVGATGSGKSELLRSIVAGLVSRRSPAEVAVVCWDFKGGAAIAPFASLPHIRGVVTNLGADPHLLDRAGRSLRAEMLRRQRILQAHGVDSLAALNLLATPPASGSSPDEPMPRLLLVVDEFSELIAAAPDLLDLFVSVGRLGRSLGIHLLLASQRFEEGRLRGLESHLRYRICLRTFSAADSQTVLGTDAAFRLPVLPGSGLLSVDGRITRFDGALADALPELIAEVRQRDTGAGVSKDVWCPPLPPALSLTVPPAAGPTQEPPAPGTVTPDLRAAVGLVDLPDQQAQVPLVVDFTRGHLAVAGGPGSGRSTLLASVLTALALGNTSAWLEIQVITGTPEVFAGLGDLPHVASVAAVDDEESVAALLTGLRRRLREAGTDGGDRHVLLVVDDWPRLRRLNEQLAGTVTDLAAGGPRSGLHLAISASGWADFRAGLREHLGTHLELRLADAYESEHGRARVAALPSVPGRLLTPDGDEAQAALPRADGLATPEGLAEAQRELVGTVLARGDRPVPRLRQLPAVVHLTDLTRRRPPPRTDRASGTVVLGGNADAGVESLALTGEDRFLAVVGESGSGRSTTLRTLVLQLRAQDIELWVLDPRRSLLPVLDASVRYAYAADDVPALLGDLAVRLGPRRPPGGLTPPELLARLRQIPAERPAVLVIDDYDLLGPAGLPGPLGPVAELLPFGVDVGLSMVIARGGAGRLGFDPGWQSFIHTGATGLLLSGDPTDGPVLGGMRLQRRAPGRGLLLRRSAVPSLVQVAVSGPASVDLRPRPECQRLRTA